MRWDNLSTSAAAEPLPFALPEATVRTFDTPAFAGMTFYEIHAKSVINRVPAVSRVPFRWTVNPYRGCSHACTYCLAGETPVLMADGGTRQLADLRPGDEICGTERDGDRRRYVTTRVLAHWSTVKPGYRVTLGDGTRLVASGDHRFLTTRGWRHVTGTTNGQRPCLAPGDQLIGTGAVPEPSSGDDLEYRLGYLCGVVRGDGQLGSGDGGQDLWRYRLGLAGPEALDRFHDYLEQLTVATGRRPVAGAVGLIDRPAVAVAELGRSPESPSGDWHRGFLAGVFDAKGSCSAGVLRISVTDGEVIDTVGVCLLRLGFGYVVEGSGDADGASGIRVAGGVREYLRFFRTVDPAVARKRTIAGAAVECGTAVEVVSVAPLGLELTLYDITTGTGDFIAGGVVSHNCFARNTHSYLDLDTGRDFDTKVVVKVNAAGVLRRELAAARWAGEPIAMGTNVDCYQRAEGRYRLMRGILAALRDAANPFSILTKGTLILRDLDLLRQAAEVTRVGISVSVGFVDEELWRSVEPGTPSPRRRLDAVRALTDAGFAVGVLLAPVLPGLTDDDRSIEASVAAIAAAGAASVTALPLHLRPGAREWYRAWLAREHPDLFPRYRQLYGRGSYAPTAYQREVTARVRDAARRHGVGLSTNAARDLPTSPAQAEDLDGGALPDRQLSLL